MAERSGVDLTDFALVVRIAAGKLAAWARRVRVLAGLVVIVCLAGRGFIDPGAIAQEVVGPYRWRTAMDPAVLTVEQEKARAATLGFDFKELCELPADDRHHCR
jgi:hypothetical protein